MESWSDKGINFSGYDIDRDEMVGHQKKVVDKLTAGVEKLIKANGGKVIRGRATLNSGTEVEVEAKSGEETVLETDNVIIATGSRPVELPGFPFENEAVWNSRDALDLPEIPEKLVILGAGVVGLEMGTIYSRLGAEVEVLEMADSILPGMDLERRFSSMLGRELKRSGIEIHTGTKAIELSEGPDEYAVIAEVEGEKSEFSADRVLSAVGRSPVLPPAGDGFELEVDENGYLNTGDRCKTSEAGVYAIGDVVGPPLLAHKAARQGLIAAAEIAGVDVSLYKAVPAAVFTDPEYAEVGLSPAEAKSKGHDPITGKFPFRASGKALAMDETEGLVQIVVDGGSDKVLGGAILGPHASDLIGEIGLAVEVGLMASQLAETIHTHPTLSEAVMEAAENAHGLAIHTGNR
jgi:dihydrolipoamide dehydrogenase